MRLLYSILLVFFATVTYANQIEIKIVDLQDESHGDDKICSLVYDITNRSTGTIYFLQLNVDGWDDRGAKLDEFFIVQIRNKNGRITGGGSSLPIPLGETQRFADGDSFKTDCRYLAEIKVDDIVPEYCNIRMLPEDIDCNSIVTLSSNIEQLTIRQ